MAQMILFSHSVMSNSLRPHGLQHARLPCPSPSPGACSNSCPLSWWCHPTISSSVVPFSSCLLHFPASESFPISSSHQLSKVPDQGNESNLFWPVRVIPFPLPVMVRSNHVTHFYPISHKRKCVEHWENFYLINLKKKEEEGSRENSPWSTTSVFLHQHIIFSI